MDKTVHRRHNDSEEGVLRTKGSFSVLYWKGCSVPANGDGAGAEPAPPLSAETRSSAKGLRELDATSPASPSEENQPH